MRTETLDSLPPFAASSSSPELATPPCPHFGRCGGCQLQHLIYSAQLDRKAARLHELLRPFNPPELQLHPSPPLAYRNRIRLTLRTIDGSLRAGYLSRASDDLEDAVILSEGALAPESKDPDPSHASATARTVPTFLPITQCPIAASILWRAAEAFLAVAHSSAWLRTSNLAPDQLELFTADDESNLQLTLFLCTAAKTPPSSLAHNFNALCESLRTQLPELAGAGIALLPLATSRSRQSAQPRPGPSWGSPGLNYTLEPSALNLDPLTYWVPRGAFFQVNRFLLPELVSLVAATATPSQDASPAWDLYAGIGLFSRALVSRKLARAFAEVTAVEIAEPAATALAQTKIPNLRAVKSTTLNFLRAAVPQRDRPSLIVLDPPRAGLGPEVCALLARIAAPQLVYVSCSPDALARDLANLTGYSVAQLHLFDLFPQTSHIETVVLLTRN